MSRNPILSDKAFDASAPTESPADEWRGAQQMGTAAGPAVGSARASMPMPEAATSGRVMTLGGVASATALMFATLLVGAFWGWNQVTVIPATALTAAKASFNSPGMLMIAGIVAFALAMVTAFKPKAARFTSLPYALFEGAVLGMISHFYDARWNGIVVQAVLATLGVFIVMLVLFGLRILRATPRFTKGVIGATFGVMVVYMAGWIANMFGVNLGFWGTGGGMLGIIVSLVVCGIAALNLILDFEFIEQGTKRGLPAYMDWYAGFGLMVTLVWLYLEILRLLARVNSR
jgi:uncharacterized YccA/Bax inhibitor family protein